MQQSVPDGARVTYLGHGATVVHGFDPSDPWLPSGPRNPATVNIRFDSAPRGVSPQQDVFVTSIQLA